MTSSAPQAQGPSPTYLTIPSKPQSPISYSFLPAIDTPFTGEEETETKEKDRLLLVFVNGLGLPARAWSSAIAILRADAGAAGVGCPPILTYDRFGQGATVSKDPLDGTPLKPNGHDFSDVAADLHEIIQTVATAHQLSLPETDTKNKKLRLLLVGASIGGPICRLYPKAHPDLVAGLVILDSNICNVNYSDIIPDPTAPGFDPSTVTAPDCTLEQYTAARLALVKMFDLNVKNAEGLDRSTGPALLPCASEPKLSPETYLSIVGHDPVTFTEGSLEKMGTPRCISERWVNPYWANYNLELTKIAAEGHCDGVVIAKGCGHFIQVDDPAFVATEITKMLKKLRY